jgi:hypothetical protein
VKGATLNMMIALKANHGRSDLTVGDDVVPSSGDCLRNGIRFKVSLPSLG